MSSRWRPNAFLRGSAALHAAVLAGAAAQPELWPWALGAIAANQAAITAGGLLPRSRLLGPTGRACRRRRQLARLRSRWTTGRIPR
jgi:peptidoglycan-N-acetylglucosamine deacetylase